MTNFNEKILEKILTGFKKITGFYPYPTGGYGMDNVIAETDNHNGGEHNHLLKNFINVSIDLGASAAGYGSSDNKTGIEVRVTGLDYPVYFYKYDGKYVITRNIRTESQKKLINWTIGY